MSEYITDEDGKLRQISGEISIFCATDRFGNNQFYISIGGKSWEDPDMPKFDCESDVVKYVETIIKKEHITFKQINRRFYHIKNADFEFSYEF